MTGKAPGKYWRKGMSLLEITRLFPDDDTAEDWFVETRWGDEITCPHCGSHNVQSGCNHRTMPYRCREKDCGKKFSVKTGTVMEGSKLGYQTWALAIYLLTTSNKGVSSMKLHRDLGVTQKTAWFLAHRIREAWDAPDVEYDGPVEVDEAYFGGREKNKHANKRLRAGRGYAGKTAVVGVKDRETNQVSAKVVASTDRVTLHEFVIDHANQDAWVYTDEARAYQGLPFHHQTVNHSDGNYVRGMIHTNGIESFWAGLKRAYKGVYHQMSPTHLHRYVNEFSGRYNVRDLDTIDQLMSVVRGIVNKRLKYVELVGLAQLDASD